MVILIHVLVYVVIISQIMIKLVVLDIDGIMTDGKKYYDQKGSVVLKTFCDKDWTSIKRFKSLGINVIFLSGDENINKQIANDRNIDFYSSRFSPKESLLKIIENRYGVDRKEICYFGDDLFDIGIMKEVGYSFCTCDSPLIVKLNSIELNVFGGNNAILHLFEYCEKYCLIPTLNYEEIMSKIYELDKKEKF